MVRYYNTRAKKARTSSQDEPTFTNEGWDTTQYNILSSINSLKDKIFNLKEIVIKNLQNDIEKVRQKCERLEILP